MSQSWSPSAEKPDKKAVFFTMLWKYSLFSSFPIGGIHSQGILLVMPLELQGKSTNHFLWHSLKRPKRLNGFRSGVLAVPCDNSGPFPSGGYFL